MKPPTPEKTFSKVRIPGYLWGNQLRNRANLYLLSKALVLKHRLQVINGDRMHPFTFYSLACNAKLLLYAIHLKLEEDLSQIQWRLFWAVVEVATVQEMFKKGSKKIPPCTLGWLQELTKIKHTSTIEKELTQLTGLGLIEFKNNVAILPKNVDESFIDENRERFAELTGKRRSLKRLVPISRHLLRELCRSTARTLHSVSIVALLRASSYDKYKKVKNTGTLKLAAIQRFTGWSKSAIAEAMRYLREKGYLESERPTRAWRVIRDGLFVKIRFSEKQDREEKPHIEIPTIDLPTGNFNNIDRGKLTSLKYILSLFYDAIRKGIIKYSEATLINFFCAAYQAIDKYRKGKSRTPEKLFSHLVRNGFPDITQTTEDTVLPKLKKFREDFAHLFVF